MALGQPSRCAASAPWRGDMLQAAAMAVGKSTTKGKPKRSTPPVIDADALAAKTARTPDAEDESDGDEAAELGDVIDAPFIQDVDEPLDTNEFPERVAPARTSLLRRDPLDAYMAQVRKIALLTVQEEQDLASRLVETGDPAAARRLVEANLRLVVKIAYEYRRSHQNLLDLVQEGNLGLIQAVRKFDPTRGVRLSSYAAFWIRAYMLKFILNNWRLVKIGTTQAQRKLFFNLRKEKQRLEQLGFLPTPKLLAEKLGVEEKDVVEMEGRLSAADASLDAPMTSEEGSASRMDGLASDSASPHRVTADTEFASLFKEKISRFVDTLEGRDKTILEERWLSDPPLTLQEIGERYGISRERARQIEQRVLGRLKAYLEAELGGHVNIGELVRDDG